jgi:hypothetical protein
MAATAAIAARISFGRTIEILSAEMCDRVRLPQIT